MSKIEVNSVESVILFVLYICIQDGKISDEELNELALEFPLLEKLYFDIYGEYVHHDFQETVDQVINQLNIFIRQSLQIFFVVCRLTRVKPLLSFSIFRPV